MKNLSKFVLVTVVLTFIGTSNVIADTYRCQTINLPMSGFSSSAVARSWFPKTTTHEIKGESGYFKEWNLKGKVSYEGTRVIVNYKDTEGTWRYVFWENGKMAAKTFFKGAYAGSEPARGRCTKTSTTAKPTPSKNRPNIKKPSGPNIPKQVQTELNRLGCNVGTADGAVGPASKRGLAKFAAVTGVTSYSVSEFSNKQFLDFLKGMPAGFCN